jgi:ATP-binding cassette subfamily B protein/subfamily B ATP-binding cassette protein MsbA
MGAHGFQRVIELDEGQAYNRGAVAARLASYLKPYWPHLTVMLILVIINAATFAAAPLLIGRAIDQFIGVGDRAGLGRTALLLLATYVVGLLTLGGQFYLMGWVGQNVLARLRDEIFAKIQALSLSYFDQHDAGDLMSRLTNDVDVLNQLLGGGLVQMLSGIFQMAAIVVAMILLNWQLALASFTIIPVMVLVINFLARRARSAFRETRETIGDVNVELEEKISGVRVAQAFSREETDRQRFAELNAANRDANVSAVGITSAFSPAMDVLSTIAIAIVIGFGGYLTIVGLATVGMVVAFLRYVQQFFRPVQQISQVYAIFQAALAAGERIFDLLDEPLDLVDAKDAQEMQAIQGTVVLEHVDFAYASRGSGNGRGDGQDPTLEREQELVLRDVNLSATPGQTIAIVGPTGAGKTTLVNLVGRFYDVTGGRVLIDGKDVRNVTRASLRRQMGIVLQDSFLFSGTVAENIRYGRLDASDEEVEAAAKAVGADPFVKSLSDGYQTELGERGGTLSQGQRQLISLARAVLADPSILILDEATANVDTRTELVIQSALEKLLQGRTSFVIAHRLSTVRNADQVYVLEDGCVVEQGAHEALLARGGAYAELYARQFREVVPG